MTRQRSAEFQGDGGSEGMKINCRIVVLVACLVCTPLAAQEAGSPRDVDAAEESQAEVQSLAEDTQDDDHEQLRKLREALTEAVINGDVEKQVKYAHEDVVTTWQNNQVARGHDGLREFMNEMSSGDQKIFQGYTVEPTSEEVTILQGGDTAIASANRYHTTRCLGMEFDLQNRWTATLVKKTASGRSPHTTFRAISSTTLSSPRQRNRSIGCRDLAGDRDCYWGRSDAKLDARKQRAPPR